MNPRLRAPLLALGIVALLTALWAGLIRLAWTFPPVIPGIGALHGPLMVCGFLGTIISLERAVALGKRWAYSAPLCCAVGAIVLLSSLAPSIGIFLFTLGSAGMAAIFYVIVRRQPALFTYTMAVAAFAWFIGNILWLAGVPLALVTLWWSAFLILTILGERLELSRLLNLSRMTARWFQGAVTVFGIGILLETLERLLFPQLGLHAGGRLAGMGMIALAAWLLRYDIARRTVRQHNLTRYIAWCLLFGYFWLGIGGFLSILYAGATSGPYYDGMLHAVFLGFVFSMIFGHMPIILPAVLGRAVTYSKFMYAPLFLLHLAVILRLAGDLLFGLAVRQWGGMLNAIAIVLFLALTARGMLISHARPLPLLARHEII